MDNELLKRVLTENSRIIIAGFGAFLHKEQGGALVFSPFLRKDDGKLSAIIELEYGVTSSEAKEMIEEFASKIRTILKVKSKYYIDNVGALITDNNGVISFVEESAAPAATVQGAHPQPSATEMPAAQVVQQDRPFQPAQPSIVQAPIPNPMPTPVIAPQPISRPIAQPTPPQPIPQPIARPIPQPAHAQQSNRVQGASAPIAPTPSPFSRPAPAQAPQPIKANGSPINGTNNVHSAQGMQRAQGAPRVQSEQGSAGARSGVQAPPRQRPQQGVNQKPRSPRPLKKSKKSDMWLIVAIIAALIVIGLMIFGIVTSSQMPPLE